MKKEELIAIFQTNFAQLTQIVLDTTVWVYEPDEKQCKVLAEGLQCLAQIGNKKAAALYNVVAAYDNNAGCFSEAIAREWLLDNEVVSEYLALVEENFKEILDEESYNYYTALPAIAFFERVIDECQS